MKKLPLTLLLAFYCAMAPAREPLGDGDLVFQTSRSRQSEAIQRATHSPYSHVGIVLFRDGKPYVFEAVASVRYTPLDAWIARGAQGRHVVKRLRRDLTPGEVARLHATVKPFRGSEPGRSCANSICRTRWSRRNCGNDMEN